ncbi:DUF2268 domain-containing protein [Shouchella shacheensis]|uniref:DUF2268 domain-containing protein n=1 Tax=Shouchella shacheensis TaxID=1649580 RepID=UPI00073FDF73|nr:DUF2268 domain-containing protein [Shouchella shacheensis]
MKIHLEDTFAQYETLFALPIKKREDFFRYTMMKPLEGMWKAIGVPLKAKEPNGYDVIMATKILGYLDIIETEKGTQALKKLQANHALAVAREALQACVAQAKDAGLHVNADDIRLGLYIADQEKLRLQKGYSGFGGIPGYVMITIDPNGYNLPRLPAVIAHEFHHNLRFSYFNWNHGDVTVGDYIVIEGLADSFARELYGEESLGPWVTALDEEDLCYSIEVIKQALDIKGFAEVSSYMFGDEVSREQGYQPVGLSFGAGYAVGYHVVQSFLRKAGVSIEEATLLGANEILRRSEVF